jgi:hypothetical protein
MRTLLAILIVLAAAGELRAVEVVRGVVRETFEVQCATGCGSYSIEPDPGYQFTRLQGNLRLYVGQHVQVTGFLDNCSGCIVLVPSEPIVLLPPTTGVGDGPRTVPSELRLAQNYPNPFNPSTLIAYELPAAAQVRLSVWNILGVEVALLADAEESPGEHRREWSPKDLPGGVYLARLETTQAGVRRVLTRRMLLVR